MINEHSRQENTSEQSKKGKLLPKATMPVVPEAQEISDEELDQATGGSGFSPNDPTFYGLHAF